MDKVVDYTGLTCTITLNSQLSQSIGSIAARFLMTADNSMLEIVKMESEEEQVAEGKEV